MTSIPPLSPPIAIQPVYPLNQPGETICVYAGKVGFQGQQVPGVIELRCSPELDLVWQVEPPVAMHTGTVELQVPLPYGDRTVAGAQRSVDHGFLHGAELSASEDSNLSRVVAHWMNLPRLGGNLPVRESGDGDDRAQWRRWVHTTGGWQLTIDARRDLSEVHEVIGQNRAIAITHVMEIRRADGQDFGIEQAREILTALQFALSFGSGRWVAPALPVGFDSAGNRVWDQWESHFCDPGANIWGSWLDFHRGADVRDLIDKVVAAFADEWAKTHEWLPLLAMAVQGNLSGRIEQRIMTLHSGLEMLIWTTLLNDQGWSENKYKRIKYNDSRLRLLLSNAGISTQVDASHLPELHSFTQDAKARRDAQARKNAQATGAAAPGPQPTVANRPTDGPYVVCDLRNRVIHPEPQRPSSAAEETTERLRRAALFDSLLLSQEYYILLLLHRLNYGGRYRSNIRTKPVETVPWAV
ncbi:hypothetical protein [Dactylosporangium sp. NPDC005555]|uniref:hypothetical protein n=1 Tax=Dactylosporangium sp. NPDC005555 TaxID=3154889 RepID=UPI0033B83825